MTLLRITQVDGSGFAPQARRTGFFCDASRFRIIEGSPEPPAWLEVFETDLQDPVTAYARACDVLES
jgi:hypothetical protein